MPGYINTYGPGKGTKIGFIFLSNIVYLVIDFVVNMTSHTENMLTSQSNGSDKNMGDCLRRECKAFIIFYFECEKCQICQI